MSDLRTFQRYHLSDTRGLFKRIWCALARHSTKNPKQDILKATLPCHSL